MLAKHVGMKSNDSERQQTGAENRRPGLLDDFLSTEELAVELGHSTWPPDFVSPVEPTDLASQSRAPVGLI